ncbi:hypothetical protein IMSHALPRED_010989 [Imshaugia aleurites]|uniref:Secreted protein n=1 Tax=Imshaugia aleurites TaxID=172621 RepID=A0A8H3IXK3_9LECA|nr:hypothetical protein IMSHALPRED_010989 [Imshaugia aleurites]
MSAFRFTFLTTSLTLFVRTLALDEADLNFFGTKLLDREVVPCANVPECGDGLIPATPVPQIVSISGWNNSACIDKPASEQVPVSATPSCFNYGSDVSSLRIDWAIGDTWATIFNDFDCDSPSNLTIARDSDSLCQPVANGYGGVNQANIPGNPGSVLFGTGNVPPQISTSSANGDNLGMLTTYFGYEGCSNDQKSQINQAQKDAVMLAANAVKSPGIDFGNSAAVCAFSRKPFQCVQQ